MPRKPPALPPHVKRVRARGREYLYFNTGRKARGKVVLARLPDLASPSFWPAYTALKAAREAAPSRLYTVADACNAFEASADFRAKSKATRDLYTYALRLIRDNFARFPLAELRRHHIQTVLDKGLPSPSLHNPFLVVLGLVYRQARREDRTDLDPTRDFARRAGGAHPPWPEEALEAGLQSAHDRTRLAVHLLYFTGQRIGDVCRLRWADVREGEIFVQQQKTGKRLWIPLAGPLQAELARTPRKGITILADRQGRPIPPASIRRDLKAHGKALGLDLVPHGLRKNAVISLLEAGCSIAEVAAITGQSYQMVEHYAAGINQRRMGKAAILKLERKRNGKTDWKTTA